MHHSPIYKSKATAHSGVWQYLQEHRYLLRKNTAVYDNNKEYQKIVIAFLKHCDIPVHMRSKNSIALDKTAQQIQVRFGKFIKWLEENQIKY